jgi:hypothetical protein
LENEEQSFVNVRAQPFGGAVRIHNLGKLQEITGDFHFDSQESLSQHDFRLFIRPAAWERVQEFCLQRFSDPEDTVLESGPGRELAEEFADALNISLRPDQYSCKPVGSIIEIDPAPTENIYARGYATARIYGIFEARILDPSLVSVMVKNSENCSDQDLRELALKDYRRGEPGRANAVLTLPLNQVSALYAATSPALRNHPISFHNHQLDETVAAILDDVAVPKYQRLLL